MKIHLDIDAEEFNRQLKLRIARSKSSFAECVNKVAWGISRRALMLTRRARKEQILALGMDMRTVSRSGKALKRPRYTLSKGANRFRAMYAARLRKKGIDPRQVSDFESRVKRALSARLRAIGFLASGWISATKILGKAARLPYYQDPEARQKGVAKGAATPAQPAINPVAIIANSAGLSGMIQGTKDQGKVLNILKAGLEQAFRNETADLRKHAQEAVKKAMA